MHVVGRWAVASTAVCVTFFGIWWLCRYEGFDNGTGQAIGGLLAGVVGAPLTAWATGHRREPEPTEPQPVRPPKPRRPRRTRRIAGWVSVVLLVLAAGTVAVGILQRTLYGSVDVTRAVFSPDGAYLATDSANGLQLWRTTDRRPLGEPLDLGGTPVTFAFTPDSTRLAVSVDHDGYSRVAVVYVDNQRLTGNPMSAGDTVKQILFTGSAAYVVIGSDIHRWDVANRTLGDIVSVGMSLLPGVVASDDGRTLAVVSYTRHVFLLDLVDHTETPVAAPQVDVNDMAFSPDGRTLAVASGNEVSLWKVKDGTTAGKPLSHSNEVRDIAFDRDGDVLHTVCDDGTLRLWRTSSGLATGGALDVGSGHGVFADDGSALLTSTPLRLWNPATGDPVGAPFESWAYGGFLGWLPHS